MKKLFLVTAILLGLVEAKAQYHPIASVDSVLQKAYRLKPAINGFSEINSIDSTIILVTELKDYCDHLYYVTLWDLAQIEPDKEKRILLFRRISTYPYYLVKSPEIIKRAGPLYELSIHQLIKEFKGDAYLLNTIQIVPAYQSKLYPKLKREIEAAGGTWERGPIQQQYDPYIQIKKD